VVRSNIAPPLSAGKELAFNSITCLLFSHSEKKFAQMKKAAAAPQCFHSALRNNGDII
jgi:hypothetical protein